MTQANILSQKPQSSLDGATLRSMANAIRALSMDAVERANSGHPGMPMGMADVATVLFSEFLHYDAAHPLWPNRDRFVLSAGHGSMLLYSILHLSGYADFPLEELKKFRTLGSKCAGHPEFGHGEGIETTTGPLGQGLANAVGMAIAERMLAAEFGDVINHHTYTIAGDGCLMEGISQEAISLAGHLKLNKLVVLWDDNSISIDGPTSLTISEDTPARFRASGWNTISIDGHDMAQIRAALATAHTSDKPTLIACKTTIAFGAPTKAGTSSSHGSPLGAKEIEGARAALGWAHAPFDIPDEIYALWRNKASGYAAWQQRYAKLEAAKKSELERRIAGELPAGWQEALAAFKAQKAEQKPSEATRKSSESVLEVLTAHIPELLGGSADLTGSNNTKTSNQQPITSNSFSGRYLYYGVREHAMGAIMNGIALHGGFIPYGGTFLVFTDYMRPAIRLSALMQQRVVYVMTHDSIGLGEDGPTHQPVEHLASLRAIPNLLVFRPADALETADCWALALARKDGPSVLSLTRQNLPTIAPNKPNLVAQGGYILSESPITNHQSPITLIATGSEVMIALEAQAKLAEKNIAARVVSMPCWELFDAQPKAYRDEVLGAGLRVAIEAASGFGWERYLGADGIFIGINSFGASAPAPELYKHFGITADAVVAAVEKRMS